MKEYILKDKVIVATEKAYNVLYKEQGYLPRDTKKDKTSKVSKETKKDNE